MNIRLKNVSDKSMRVDTDSDNSNTTTRPTSARNIHKTAPNKSTKRRKSHLDLPTTPKHEVNKPHLRRGYDSGK